VDTGQIASGRNVLGVGATIRVQDGSGSRRIFTGFNQTLLFLGPVLAHVDELFFEFNALGEHEESSDSTSSTVGQEVQVLEDERSVSADGHVVCLMCCLFEFGIALLDIVRCIQGSRSTDRFGLDPKGTISVGL
jgi:hypothetical protein